jgi:hypothetical protein
VKSDCQHSFGCSASNRRYDERGRLRGPGVTSPAPGRYRLTVAGGTRTWWWCSRCQAIVCGPASRPCPARSLRSRVIRSAVASGIADGEVFGRRDRGSNAASPRAVFPLCEWAADGLVHGLQNGRPVLGEHERVTDVSARGTSASAGPAPIYEALWASPER